MDEREVRTLLDRVATSGGPPSSVDVEKARRAGLHRLRLLRLGAPLASLGAVVVALGLVTSGLVPLGIGPGIGAGYHAQATVRLTNGEVAVLTNTGSIPRAVMKISNTFQLLIQRCMESKRLKYYPLFQTVPVREYPAPHGFPGLAGVPQAPISLAAREAHGYGFYDGALWYRAHPDAGGPTKETRYADSAGPSYRLAVDGPANDRVAFRRGLLAGSSMLAGGCLGAAERRLYGSVRNYALATEGSSLLPDALLSAVTADPAFAVVVSKWSTCMAMRGFIYRGPEDLWNSLGGQIDVNPTPAMRHREIRISVADYMCAKAVALLATVRALQNHHARYYSRALAGYLAQLTRIDAAALRVARSMRFHQPGR